MFHNKSSGEAVSLPQRFFQVNFLLAPSWPGFFLSLTLGSGVSRPAAGAHLETGEKFVIRRFMLCISLYTFSMLIQILLCTLYKCWFLAPSTLSHVLPLPLRQEAEEGAGHGEPQRPRLAGPPAAADGAVQVEAAQHAHELEREHQLLSAKEKGEKIMNGGKKNGVNGRHLTDSGVNGRGLAQLGSGWVTSETSREHPGKSPLYNLTTTYYTATPESAGTG